MLLPDDLDRSHGKVGRRRSPDIMTSDHYPSVAVVIPCWNAEKWIGRAIQSVIDQNYANAEIIVIDDGSTDGGLEIIKSFGDKIRWETGPNRGAGAARNRGLSRAVSQYVLFLDADDYIEGNYVSGLAQAAEAAKAELTIGCGADEKPDGRRRYRFHYQPPWDHFELIAAILSRECLQTSQVLWRREFLLAVGGWSERTIVSMDVELSVRALLARPVLTSSASGCAIWNLHEDPARVSRRVGAAAIESGLMWFGSVKDGIVESGNISAITALARLYYNVAVRAHSRGLHDLGRAALTSARQLGLRGHQGGSLHRVASTLLGLELKSKLSQTVHKLPMFRTP